jgi:Uma2 family endonuclease
MATTQIAHTRDDASDPLARIQPAIAALQAHDTDEVDVAWLTGLALTLEEFLALPEVKPALEYEEGRVTQKMSPKVRHAAVQIHLAMLFDRYGRPNKVARAFPEMRFALPGAKRSYVPDVAVYRWDRVPTLPNGELDDDARTMPDITVEVISPGQRISEALAKCRWYIENGARIALFVNTRDSSVTLFRPGEEPQLLRGQDHIDLSDILPGCRISVDEVFSSLRHD